MTVGKKDGATVPLWAAVTVIVSILLAVGGFTVGAVSRAADSEHKAIIGTLQGQLESDRDREMRLRVVERAVVTLQAQYDILIAGQERILRLLDVSGMKE
jgi:hypothetical protein